MARRGGAPEVNAGSMADIAFLLLIFFLVTTTIESDKGLTRRLPPIDDSEVTTDMKKRNIFDIIIGREGDLFVQDNRMKLEDLRESAIAFIDNGGGTGSNACSYCQGTKNPESSESPKKAVVSIAFDRQTDYGSYIAVQNEVMAAYNTLRNRVANAEYGEDFTDFQNQLNMAPNDAEKDKIKAKIDRIRSLYPLNISEAKLEKIQ